MMLFGKANKAPTPSETIAKLQDTVTTMEKRAAYLSLKVQEQLNEAVRLMKAKRKAGMFQLSHTTSLRRLMAHSLSPAVLLRAYLLDSLGFPFRPQRLFSACAGSICLKDKLAAAAPVGSSLKSRSVLSSSYCSSIGRTLLIPSTVNIDEWPHANPFLSSPFSAWRTSDYAAAGSAGKL